MTSGRPSGLDRYSLIGQKSNSSTACCLPLSLTDPRCSPCFHQNDHLFEMLERLQGKRIDDQRCDMSSFFKVSTTAHFSAFNVLTSLSPPLCVLNRSLCPHLCVLNVLIPLCPHLCVLSVFAVFCSSLCVTHLKLNAHVFPSICLECLYTHASSFLCLEFPSEFVCLLTCALIFL